MEIKTSSSGDEKFTERMRITPTSINYTPSKDLSAIKAKANVDKLRLRIRKLERFVKECRDDWYCDAYDHPRGTQCRKCAAKELLRKK